MESMSAAGLYQFLVAVGATLDHHESDLYVLDTPEARAIVEASGAVFTSFVSATDGKNWLDVPFAYEPFWTARIVDGTLRGAPKEKAR
jgi:hypothetical protein